MRNLFVVAALAMPAAVGCGPSQAFTSRLGSSGTGLDRYDYAEGIATDRGGKVSVAGSTFGRFPGSDNAGGLDAVVIQLDGSGVPQWIRQLGTAGNDDAAGISTDGSGHLYVAGSTSGDFPGFTNAGSEDVFVIKLDGDGAVQWTRQLGTAGIDAAKAIATDGSGNVYVAGTTDGSFPGFTNAGREDVFVVKLSGDGAQQWVQQVGSQARDWISGVATDGGGNVFAVGVTEGSFPGFEYSSDGMVIKYDGGGALQWVRQLEASSFSSSPSGVATDAGGNLCVAGTQAFEDSHALTVTKLDGNGAKLWKQSVGQQTFATGVATDGDGNVFVTGFTEGSLPGAGSAGGIDMVVIKFDAGGTQQWLTQYGTSGGETGVDVAPDDDGQVFVTGNTRPSGEAGDTDLFLMKFDSRGTPRP